MLWFLLTFRGRAKLSNGDKKAIILQRNHFFNSSFFKKIALQMQEQMQNGYKLIERKEKNERKHG